MGRGQRTSFTAQAPRGVADKADGGKFPNPKWQLELPKELEDKPGWSWSQEEIRDCYGLDLSTGGDAVPGGYNMYIVAYEINSGKKVGWIDLNTANDHGVIADLQVEKAYQGQSIARKLLDYARRYDPEMSLSHGMTTEQGEAWRKSLPLELQGEIKALALSAV